MIHSQPSRRRDGQRPAGGANGRCCETLFKPGAGPRRIGIANLLWFPAGGIVFFRSQVCNSEPYRRVRRFRSISLEWNLLHSAIALESNPWDRSSWQRANGGASPANNYRRNQLSVDSGSRSKNALSRWPSGSYALSYDSVTTLKVGSTRTSGERVLPAVSKWGYRRAERLIREKARIIGARSRLGRPARSATASRERPRGEPAGIPHAASRAYSRCRHRRAGHARPGVCRRAVGLQLLDLDRRGRRGVFGGRNRIYWPQFRAGGLGVESFVRSEPCPPPGGSCPRAPRARNSARFLPRAVHF